MIRAAHEQGKQVQVIADETRPWLQGLRLTAFELMEEGIPVHVIADNAAGYLMRQKKIQLAITGADGMPELVNAGNTLLPNTTLKLSFRLPPTGDADLAASAVKEALEADAPTFAKVSFDVESTMAGWNAPPVAPWLEASMEQASQDYFGKPSVYMGTGGTIPFMGMLGEKFPQAQFLVTGLLGPNSNAHGPNEFLHIEKGKKLTCCVAQVLEDHLNS